MRLRYKIFIVVAALAGAFAAGRFSTPVKIVTVEKQVTSTDTDTTKHKITTKKELDKPDGTKEIITVTRDDTSILSDIISKTEETQSVTKDSRKVNIYALGGIDALNPSGVVLGAHVSAGVLGPIQVGVFGLTSGVVGASIGLGL